MTGTTTLGLNFGPIEEKDGLYCGVNLSVLNAESVNGGMVELPMTISNDQLVEMLTGKMCLGIAYNDNDRDWRAGLDIGLVGYEIVNVRLLDMADSGLLINADIRVLDTIPGQLLKTYLDKPGELNFRMAAEGHHTPNLNGEGSGFTVTALRSFDLIIDRDNVGSENKTPVGEFAPSEKSLNEWLNGGRSVVAEMAEIIAGNEHIKNIFKTAPYINRRIKCADGFSISIQAGLTMNSYPKENIADMAAYSRFEYGFPIPQSPYLSDTTGTITREELVMLVAEHGGIVGYDTEIGHQG